MDPLRTVGDPAVLAALTARLERLTSERARVWGTMSAHQMVVHLTEANEAALKRRAFTPPRRRASQALRVVFLHLPVRWPRGIRTGADPAGRILPADSFEADRLQAIVTLGEVAGGRVGALERHHPVFGPMTPANWHRWAFLHTDHHLRQFGL